MNPGKASKFGKAIENFDGRDFDITLITDKPLSNAQTKRIQQAFKDAFGQDLGIRNIVDQRQLDYIPVYGKIDLEL